MNSSSVSYFQVCPTAMSRILYFMYTGQIRVTEVTVCQLLPAATMFQVPNVIDACCAFLERQLDPTNAIGIANFAEQHGCVDLQKKANVFIERNFTQVSDSSLSFHVPNSAIAMFPVGVPRGGVPPAVGLSVDSPDPSG